MVARNLLRALTFAAMVVRVSDPASSVLTRELSKMPSSTASASLSTAMDELAETATTTPVSDMGSNDGGTMKPYAGDSDDARHESEQTEYRTASITEKRVTTSSASNNEMESSKSISSSNSETGSNKHVSSGRKERSSAATLSEINSSAIRDETRSQTLSAAEGSSDSTSIKETSSSNSDPPSSGDVTQVASSSDGAVTQGVSSSSGDVTQDTLPFGGNVKQKDDDNAAAKRTMAKREAAKEARHKAQAERKAKREAQKKEWRKIKEQQMAELKAAKERVKSDTSAIQAAAGFTVNSTDTTQHE